MSTVRLDKEIDKMVDKYLAYRVMLGFDRISKQEIVRTILKNSLKQRIVEIEKRS